MVEGGGLENRCAARYRGFESPLLRPGKKNTGKIRIKDLLILPDHWGIRTVALL